MCLLQDLSEDQINIVADKRMVNSAVTPDVNVANQTYLVRPKLKKW